MAEEQTTTDASVMDSGAPTALPEDQTNTQTAATETSSQQQQDTSTSGGDEHTPSEVDDKLKAYADSKGIVLDSESSIKAAKIAMDSQADYSRRQQASKLRESVNTISDDVADQVAQNTGRDPDMVKRLQRMEVKEAIRDFWDANPDARAYEQKMAEELQVRPHLAGDLEALYAVVRSKNPAMLKSEGGREALESLAGKQQAAAVHGNAVNPAPISTPNDPFLAGLKATID